MPALTHVLFDFFGTLVAYSESRVEQGFSKSHRVLLGAGAPLSYAHFLARWDATCDEFESRAQQSLDEFSMDDVCGEFLQRALGRTPDADLLVNFRETYLSEWNKGVRYLPGVTELLADLAERFTLVLVTNTHQAELVHAHLQAMRVASDFSAVITSIEHGKRKPSRSIFDLALARTSGRPEASIYIGDSFSADYCGATAAGLRCLLIDSECRHDVPAHDRLAHILDVASRLDQAVSS